MRWLWLTGILACAAAHADYQGHPLFTPPPIVTECGVKSESPPLQKPAPTQVHTVRKPKAKPGPVTAVKKPLAPRRAKRVSKPLPVAQAAPETQFCVTPVADKVKPWAVPEYPPMPKAQWQSAPVFWPAAVAHSVAPEPPTLSLLMAGALALKLCGRRQLLASG